MDTLIGLTDVMQKLDTNLEGIMKRVEKQHRDLEPEWVIRISTNAGDSILGAALFLSGYRKVHARLHVGRLEVPKVEDPPGAPASHPGCTREIRIMMER